MNKAPDKQIYQDKQTIEIETIEPGNRLPGTIEPEAYEPADQKMNSSVRSEVRLLSEEREEISEKDNQPEQPL